MTFTSWLPLIFMVLGFLVIVGAALIIARTDLRWTPAVLYCCRCRRSWSGVEKYCRCGAKGRKMPPPKDEKPAYDWQGYMDTGPIPAVHKD